MKVRKNMFSRFLFLFSKNDVRARSESLYKYISARIKSHGFVDYEDLCLVIDGSPLFGMGQMRELLRKGYFKLIPDCTGRRFLLGGKRKWLSG